MPARRENSPGKPLTIMIVFFAERNSPKGLSRRRVYSTPAYGDEKRPPPPLFLALRGGESLFGQVQTWVQLSRLLERDPCLTIPL